MHPKGDSIMAARNSTASTCSNMQVLVFAAISRKACKTTLLFLTRLDVKRRWLGRDVFLAGSEVIKMSQIRRESPAEFYMHNQNIKQIIFGAQIWKILCYNPRLIIPLWFCAPPPLQPACVVVAPLPPAGSSPPLMVSFQFVFMLPTLYLQSLTNPIISIHVFVWFYVVSKGNGLSAD